MTCVMQVTIVTYTTRLPVLTRTETTFTKLLYHVNQAKRLVGRTLLTGMVRKAGSAFMFSSILKMEVVCSPET
jgi:hypothetical protein